MLTGIKEDKRAIIGGASVQIVGAVIAGVVFSSLEVLLLSCVLSGMVAGYLAKESDFLVAGYVASLTGLLIFGVFSFAFNVYLADITMVTSSAFFLATTFFLALLGGIGGSIGRLGKSLTRGNVPQ